jgi:glycosyltransferase involved in cell wall biosynthesis
MAAKHRAVAAKPAISVVIPTRDRSLLVCRALDSVARQSYAAADVVVVDDGSSDDTVAAVMRLGMDLRVIEGGGRGPSAARNAGVAAARTEWVAFLDSDDLWHEDHLARLAAAIAATEGVAALYFTDADLPGGGTAWRRSGFAPAVPFELADPGARFALRPVQPMMTPAVVVARADYLACGGQDPALPCREDTHLFLLLGLGGPACAVAARTVTVTDDARDERLTAQLPGSDAAYWHATTRLYGDVLRRLPGLPADDVRELQRRIATAHWRLGRLAWRRGRRGEAAGSAWRSARSDPSVILGRVARRP